MINTRLTIALIALSSLLLNACSSEHINSEDIKTSGIYAEMTVKTTTDTASTVKVILKSGGANSNTYVDLTAGDSLVSTIDSNNAQTLSRQENNVTHEISYTTSYSATGAGVENALYNIAFNRPSDTSAPVSNLAADKSTFSRSTELLTLSWTSVNASDQLSLSASGTCINGFSVSTVDNGTYYINAGQLTNSGSPATCTVTFSLSRSKSGTLDPMFVNGEGGTISATQTRSISLTSTP